MEYCKGLPLHKTALFKDFKAENKNELLDMIMQAFLALDYISNIGYVHGDLKPDNIIISNKLVSLSVSNTV
jgi:serine/threonine protein kinase